jgi:hypothetical protein
MAFTLTYTSLVQTILSYAERQSDQQLIDRIPQLVLFAQRRIAREVKILGMQQYVQGTFTATNGIIAKPSRWLNTISMSLGMGAGQLYKVIVDNPGTLYNFPPQVTDGPSATGTGATYKAFVTNGLITQIVQDNPGTGYQPGGFTLVITPDSENTGSGAAATAYAYADNNVRAVLLPRSYEWSRMYWPNDELIGLPKYYADYDFNHWLVVPTPNEALPIEIAYYQVDNLIDDTTSENWLTQNAPDLLLYACLLEASPFLKNPDKTQEWNAMYTAAKQGFMGEDDLRIADRTTTRLNNKAAGGGP